MAIVNFLETLLILLATMLTISIAMLSIIFVVLGISLTEKKPKKPQTPIPYEEILYSQTILRNLNQSKISALIFLGSLVFGLIMFFFSSLIQFDDKIYIAVNGLLTVGIIAGSVILFRSVVSISKDLVIDDKKN